jgi:hypothetical protein
MRNRTLRAFLQMGLLAMKKLTIFLFTSFVLAGCGTVPPWVDRAVQLAEQGRCDESVQEVENGASSGRKNVLEGKAMTLAAIYYACHKDTVMSTRWATLAARYGNEPSIELLTRMGAPVPQPDLKNKSQNISPAEAMLLLGAAQSLQPQFPVQPLPATTSTNCWRNGSMVHCTSN